MDFEAQLKLQAFLDGELRDVERREIAERLARDPEAKALLGELRMTRETVKSFEEGVTLPESREFYWSKIERHLRQPEVTAAESKVAAGAMVWLRRLLLPATALGAITTAVAARAYVNATAGIPAAPRPEFER